MKRKYQFIISILFILLPVLLMGQGKPYEGPIDPAGDPAMEREGYMSGNQFKMLFNNNTQISDYEQRDASKWPNNHRGTKLLDVCSVEIGAEVYITQDSIPVTDLAEVARLAALGQIDTLYYVQTQDYHRSGQHLLDDNWNQTVEWALSPVPGYINLTSDYPAMSNRPDSWPVDGWPSTDYDTKWQGQWFGRYGAGLVSADLETYFVANDAQDLEYIVDRASGADELLITEGPRYHPRGKSQKFIGDDARPGFDATTQTGKPWGGLGIRVEVRGYQWDRSETKDMIFWEYNIANISDYNLPTTGFGYFIDPSIGGDTGGDGETCYFDSDLDLSYIWEVTGVGAGGLPTGTFGMAYLESPGKPYDNVDNDNDGLLNEERDDEAGELIGPYEGIDNLANFLDYYNYEESDLRWHFEGDEDQDWFDGNDVNNNGVYGVQDPETGIWQLEPGEDAGDDVGLDGLGPMDRNYPGPDEGECNHRPDYVLGKGCEPNFNAQDVSEADQIGLTSQHMMDLGEWGSGYKHDQDERIWNLMKSHTFVSEYTTTSHIFEFFASSTFPLYQGKVERISIAMLAAYDDLTELMSETHEAPRLFKKKENAQVIYERDYQFAQAPERPTLKAYAGDGKVMLTWDHAAELYTREPLLGRENDFEGYKLYRSTDKYFQDVVTITDAHGVASFEEPIFQCDKVDSITGYSILGIHDMAGRAGTAFYLGDDSGISNSYVDYDVQNGRTYYYYLAAYDYGIEEFDIPPEENGPDYYIDPDTEEIERLGINVQIVTPRSTAAGYIPPYINIDEARTTESILETEIVPDIAIPGAVKANHTYRVTFGTDTIGSYRKKSDNTYHPMDMILATNALYVYDETDGDQLVYSETYEDCPRNNIIRSKSLWEQEGDASSWDYTVFDTGEKFTDIFDGIELTLNLAALDTASLDVDNSKWVTGSSNMTVETGKVSKYFAWDYDIIFTDTVGTKGTKTTKYWRDINGEYLSKGVIILDHEYNFYVVNNNSLDENNQPEKLDLVVHDIDGNKAFDWQTDIIYASHIAVEKDYYWSGAAFAIHFNDVTDESDLPKAGDKYQIRFNRPKTASDQFIFSVSPEVAVEEEKLKTDMDLIRVVPNPYIATNSMESAVSNPYMNQGRRIMFTHLPAKCVIRIFTPVGVLVDKLEVENDVENGIAHWDLLTKEDLEIAAGMYIYQVEDEATGKSKVGKFAVIK